MSNANSLSNSIGLYTRKPMPAITALASAITTALTLEYSNLRGLSIGCRKVERGQRRKRIHAKLMAVSAADFHRVRLDRGSPGLVQLWRLTRDYRKLTEEPGPPNQHWSGSCSPG